MNRDSHITAKLTVVPFVEERWDDLEKLFGKSGACEGCWCMFWRLSSKEYKNTSAEDRKNALYELSRDLNHPPGLLCYADDKAVGWLGFGPRKSMNRILRSRVIPKVDDQDVWSIVCFFIHKEYRGIGMSSALLEAAKEYAAANNIGILEAYPVDTENNKINSASAYCGILSVFERQEFLEITKTKSKVATKGRVLVRLEVTPQK